METKRLNRPTLHEFFLLTALAALSTLTNCSSTGDPRQGGIFWSEPKAQQRQYVMKSELAHERSLTASVQNRNYELRSEMDQRKSDTARLSGQVSSTEAQNSATQSQVEARRRELAGIRAEIGRLEAQKQTLLNDPSYPEAQKHVRISQLKTEIEKLKVQENLLSKELTF